MICEQLFIDIYLILFSVVNTSIDGLTLRCNETVQDGGVKLIQSGFYDQEGAVLESGTF